MNMYISYLYMLGHATFQTARVYSLLHISLEYIYCKMPHACAICHYFISYETLCNLMINPTGPCNVFNDNHNYTLHIAFDLTASNDLSVSLSCRFTIMSAL